MNLGRMVLPRATRSLLGVSAILVSAMTALGQWPEVIDDAPANAQAIIAIHSLDQLTKNWNEFTTAIGADQMPLPQPEDFFVQQGIDPGTIRTDRSCGIVVMKGSWQNGAPPVVSLLPVTDFNAFVESVGGTLEGGIATFTMGPEAQSFHAKKSGDYAVVGLDHDLIAGFEPGGEANAALRKAVGRFGETVAGRSGVIVLVDTEGLDEILGPMIEEQMNQFSGMAAMGGGDIEEAQRQAAMMQAMLMAAMKDASGMAMRFGADKDGFGVDLAVNWKRDGEVGRYFTSLAEPRNLLTSFPDQPFILAFASDLRGIHLSELMDNLKAKMEELAITDAEAQEQMEMSMSLWKKANGMGMVIYPSPAGIAGGLISNSVMLYTGDVASLRDAWKTMVVDLHEREIQEVTYQTQFREGEVEVDGRKVDEYQIRMRSAPGAMQVQQMLTMLYGPAGMRGYLAPTDDGLLQTIGSNKKLLRDTLAAIGTPDGLGSNDMIEAVNEFLPEQPVARAYFSLGAVASSYGPLLQMGNPNLQFDAIMAAPPIAAGMTVDDGAMFGSLIAPAPLIRAAFEIATMWMTPQAPAEEEEPIF